jgi:hypothetical protein
VRNADYVIRITTKHGRTWSYLNEDNGWTQTGPTGVVHPLSAEQLLSHILPPLAADQPGLSVRVERRSDQVKGKVTARAKRPSFSAAAHAAGP